MSFGSTDFSPDRQLSNATDLTTRVDDETSNSKKSSSIDLEDADIEFNSIAFGDRQQTISASSDHEDLLLPSSVLRSDPTETDPLLQLHHNDVLVSATTVPSSSRRELGNNIEESDEGFQTPTNRIPLITECPPAPRKPKSQKRTITSLLREEGELYCGDDHLQLLIEVDMWLNFLEDEDRKRIKKARRQAGQGRTEARIK
ncbi:hypothetical protein QQ045_005270 [Rhodiola kirilowii]